MSNGLQGKRPLRTRCRCRCAPTAAVRAWFSLRTMRGPWWCARGARGGHPARACGPSPAGPSRCADGSIGCLAGHRRLSKELRAEILHRDGVVVRHDLLRPLAPGILPLPGDLLVGLRTQLPRLAVPLRGRLSFGGLRAGHHSVVPRHFLLGLLPVLGMGKVVRVRGCGRGLLHTPVDPDHRAGSGQRLDFGRHDERGVPMADALGTHARKTGQRATLGTTPWSGRCRPSGAGFRLRDGSHAWCS